MRSMLAILASAVVLAIQSVVAKPNLLRPRGEPKVVSFTYDRVNKNPFNIPYRNRERHRKRDGTQTILQLVDNAVSACVGGF